MLRKYFYLNNPVEMFVVNGKKYNIYCYLH